MIVKCDAGEYREKMEKRGSLSREGCLQEQETVCQSETRSDSSSNSIDSSSMNIVRKMLLIVVLDTIFYLRLATSVLQIRDHFEVVCTGKDRLRGHQDKLSRGAVDQSRPTWLWARLGSPKLPATPARVPGVM